ncbi:MAG: ATP-dependent metallopeptidase FtsH/Yme1/Tma family protein, partial [Steroidobacteraceae bacterium]
MADKKSLRLQDPGHPQRKPTPRSPRDPKRPQGNPGGPPPFRIGPLSWLILALLIIWNAWAFMPHNSVQVALPYSEFVHQIASGNVTAVTIVGAAIKGKLAHPLTWPQPKAKQATSPGKTPAQGKKTSAQDKKTSAQGKLGPAVPGLTAYA